MLNSCNFIGRCGADPDHRKTQDGKSVASFSIAVTQKWKSKDGEQREKTEWIRVVCFNEGLCRVIESYVKKGSKVYISGSMQTRKWQNKEGQDQYTTEIVMQGFDSKLVMLDSRSDGDSQRQSGGQQQQSQGDYGAGRGGTPIDDEIPFFMSWK